MTGQTAAITYLIPEPFEKALKLLRKALLKGELQIPAEFEVSGRISRQLGVGLAPCRILFVDCPFLLLEAMALDVSAIVLLPLHVVVSSRGLETAVYVQRSVGSNGSGFSFEQEDPVSKLHTRVSRVLQKIAMKEVYCEATF